MRDDFEFNSSVRIDLGSDIAEQIASFDAFDLLDAILQQPELTVNSEALSAFRARNRQLIEGNMA